MDKQITYKENAFVRELNRIAEEAYRLKECGDVRYKTEQNKMAQMITNWANITNRNNDNSEFLGTVDEVIMSTIKIWKPGAASFWPVFKGTLNKRRPDIALAEFDPFEQKAKKKMKRDSKNLTDEEKAKQNCGAVREDLYSSDDSEDEPAREFAGNADTEEEVLQKDIQNDIMKKHFGVLNNIVLTKKKQYENSVKICYTKYFYTELVTKMVYDEPDISVFSKAEKSLMKIVEHDFISHYLIGDNSSIDGIAAGRLKKISDFTGDPNDNRPCGYALENVVYTKFISKLKNNKKDISDSAISQQRKIFEEYIRTEFKSKSDSDND